MANAKYRTNRSPNIYVDSAADAEIVLTTPKNGGIRLDVSSGADLQGYDGPYVVTPTREEQELPTKYRNMSQNVIVNPIPSNYGLITWDGSVLTVS